EKKEEIKKEEGEKKEGEEPDKKAKKPKIKESNGSELVILNPITGKEYRFDKVTDYIISKEGNNIAFISAKNDSLERTEVSVFNTKKEETKVVFKADGISKKMSFDEAGKQLVFMYTADTAKTKIYEVMYWDNKADQAKSLVSQNTEGMPDGWSPSDLGNLSFSESGKRIMIGTKENPEPEKKDTLLAEEKYKVDIWNWKDYFLQPEQLIKANREKNKTFLAVYFINESRYLQLGCEKFDDIRIGQKGDADKAITSVSRKYSHMTSWDAQYYDWYIVDVKTGEKEMIWKEVKFRPSFSPNGKFISFYSLGKRAWYSYDPETKVLVNMTKDIPVNFYRETDDRPQDPGAHGSAGWTKDDEFILLYDAYDIWKVDPAGKIKAENITNGYGRKNELRIRYVRLDREAEFVSDKEDMLLKVFGVKTKKDGFYRTNLKSANDPVKIVMEDVRYSSPTKSKEAEKLLWTKSTFAKYPELRISDMDFTNVKVLSETNPQQKDYNWGTSELFEWTSFTGEELQGILYKPENFDKTKKYPVMTYFYEKSSDGLHQYTHPNVSSSINKSYLVSNGYLVFVPDINYVDGYPGKSAYNAIVSGVQCLINEYDFVNREKIGLQGHSWGGYQIAYLITQTDLFACAESGAPVVNMTSAYGGIRWASGMNRAFQYEKTQSRIGGTLWEKPMHYIENSPLFYAPNCNTPVLILHNDNDGAVPWYQGIEFFTALRRLQKPVWLVNYNGEGHGVVKWPNKVDWTIRMNQFFDHYLKDAPAPEWMVYGIPAVDKGKKDGYNLIDVKSKK
ncbi:prolyl oligopeptidase family serine peptidase, partial [Bacteroidota bacterium]